MTDASSTFKPNVFTLDAFDVELDICDVTSAKRFLGSTKVVEVLL